VGGGRSSVGEVAACFGGVYANSRVLITGHTGFKGSWLALWLIRLGARVAGYSLGPPTEPCNFDVLGLAGHMEHRVGDIRDRAALGKVIDEFRPEVIFHLAAQALVRRSYAEPALTFETNAMGMVNVLECVRTRPWIKTAILITSDKTYRNEEWCWGYRETDALGGRDPYSGSKSCADHVAYAYYHSFLKGGATRVAMTRAGNVIGGGDWAPDRIVPDCIRAWVGGQSVAVRSPQATRPWQHVLEPLSGYLSLGSRLLVGQPGLDGEAFNFGPDAHVTETVQNLLEAMTPRWAGACWHVPQGAGAGAHEAKLLKLSCDKALFHLQWRAILSFKQTVEFTVDWYRTWRDGGTAMHEYTTSQILRYCDLGRQQGHGWAME
jgi:CDP-glucose 4,6-dehydratase